MTFGTVNRGRQSGTVLIISLIFLFVLTLVAAASINTTVMEEKMAANHQYKTVTFQVAESAIQRQWSASVLDQRVNYANVGEIESILLGRDFDPVKEGPVETRATSQLIYCGERAAPGTGMNSNLATNAKVTDMHVFSVRGLGEIDAVNAISLNERRGGLLGKSLNNAPCVPDL